MRSKLLIVLLISTISSMQAYAQSTILIDMLDGFNKLASGMSSLVTSYKSIDDMSNKAKVEKLIGEMKADIGELITTKTLIVNKLKDTIIKNQNYNSEIHKLYKTLQSLETKLDKSEKLFLAAGVKTQDLIVDLKADYHQKLGMLQTARIYVNDYGLSDAGAKKVLITYFTTCINLLKSAMSELKDFSKVPG